MFMIFGVDHMTSKNQEYFIDWSSGLYKRAICSQLFSNIYIQPTAKQWKYQHAKPSCQRKHNGSTNKEILYLNVLLPQ